MRYASSRHFVGEIVRLHRGTVHIVSAPGRGTTVTVWLPLAGEAAAQETAPLAPAALG